MRLVPLVLQYRSIVSRRTHSNAGGRYGCGISGCTSHRTLALQVGAGPRALGLSPSMNNLRLAAARGGPEAGRAVFNKSKIRSSFFSIVYDSCYKYECTCTSSLLQREIKYVVIMPRLIVNRLSGLVSVICRMSQCTRFSAPLSTVEATATSASNRIVLGLHHSIALVYKGSLSWCTSRDVLRTVFVL